MDNILNNKKIRKQFKQKQGVDRANNLAQGRTDTTYAVKAVSTDDVELRDFLFTLGCYEGEQITIISKLADNFIVAIKDARYSINHELAQAIIV